MDDDNFRFKVYSILKELNLLNDDGVKFLNDPSNVLRRDLDAIEPVELIISEL